MDYEPVRAGMEAAIPFNRYLGLSVAEVADGRGVVVLPQADHLHNHVGSQHAGALFSAGEAASGAAFVGAFAERMGELTPLARTAEIDYMKLAKGPSRRPERWGRRPRSCSPHSTQTARSSSP